MKLNPLNDMVILQQEEAVSYTAGGIALAPASAEDSDFAKVLACGPGKRQDNGERVAMDVTVGDKVMFDRQYARPAKVDGKDILIIAAENLIAIVEE